MSIVLSDEQKIYVQTSGKVILNACPGSGKTTTVAHKLFSLTQNWEKNFSPNAGIVCISFTNVAKNEIAEKYKAISGFALLYPHVISTIDSFINSYITLPFAHKVKDIGKRYRIIDDIGYLNNIFLSDWQIKKTYSDKIYRFAPSLIDYTIDGGISWDGHDKSEDEEFVKYGKAIKKKQFDFGLLKTSDSAFFAYHILKKYPRIAKYLATKFPYLIIDEAQDTSEIQHSILEMLYEQGLKNIDLVGDPYQCLYQWRNASPELFLKKFDDKTIWNGINLSENRRSTKKIIDVFSILRRSSEKAIVPINDNVDDLPLHIIKYDSSNYANAISKYENLCINKGFTSNNILVRGNTLKNSLLGKEKNYSPWQDSLPYLLVESKINLQSNEIKEAVKKIRRVIIGLLVPNISFEDLKEKEQEVKNDKQINSLIFNLIRGLPSFDLPISDWTTQTQQYLKAELELDDEPDFKIRKRNTSGFDKTTLGNQVNKYFKKATTDNNLPITTIHQVKGMTFDSVFLLLSEDSSGQNISLKDFTLKKDDMPSEKQRLIYVAISRPRHLLCVGVPNSTTDNDLKKQFSDEIIIL
jgi:DNA helicase II / ATP-dependent DNA helicase PcrA